MQFVIDFGNLVSYLTFYALKPYLDYSSLLEDAFDVFHLFIYDKVNIYVRPCPLLYHTHKTLFQSNSLKYFGEYLLVLG